MAAPTHVATSAGNGTGADLTINYPTGTVAGDYVVAFVYFYKTTGTAAPDVSTPSGWTPIGTFTSSAYRVVMFGRFFASGASQTFSATSATDTVSIGHMLAYRGVDTVTPYTDAQGGYSLDSTSSHTSPSVTSTSAENAILRSLATFAKYAGTPSFSWASSIERADHTIAPVADRKASASAATSEKAAAGATGTETATQSASVVNLTALRMDKSGSYPAPANSLTKVTGWAPGTGATSVDIVNNELVVNGDGNITVSVQLTRSSTDSTNSNIRLYRNGVQVQASATFGFANTQSLSWTGNVAAGDTLAAYYYAQNAFNGTNITAGYVQYTVNSVTGSATAHKLAATVALQPVQNISLNAGDAYDLAATESGSTTSTLSAADAKDVVATEAAPTIQHTGLAADAKDVVATESGSTTSILSADDAKDLVATEAHTITGTASGADAVDLVATEDQLVTNAVFGNDTKAFPAPDTATGIAMSDADGPPAIADAATLSAQVSAADAKDLTATEDGLAASQVAGSDAKDLVATESGSIRQAAADTGTVDETETASTSSQRTVGDTVTTADNATNVAVAANADAVTVTASEFAFRSSDGVLAAPRLVTVQPEPRSIGVEDESRWIVVEPQNRRTAIGAEGLRAWPRRIQVLAEDRSYTVEAE